MKKRQFLIGLISMLILQTGCISRNHQIENIHSFAKVYGYVRWFYPSDEATQINWNKFAVYGIRETQNCASEKELKETLLRLFRTIAPALSITEENSNTNFDVSVITPPDTSGLRHVSWKHYGVYLGEKSNIYRSVRINRESLEDRYKDSVRTGDRQVTTKPGDHIKKNIGNGLILIMPLSLYGNEEHTFPPADTCALNLLKKYLDQIPDKNLRSDNRNVHLANIIIAWNVFQHFFPYFDAVHTDWETELNRSLEKTYYADSEAEYFTVLQEMTSKLQDAHVNISGTKVISYGVKIKVDLFGNDVVIVTSGSEALKNGDIIKDIDGHDALSEIKKKEELFSASSNVKRFRAVNAFGIELNQDDARITLLRDGREIVVKEKRFPTSDQFFRREIFDNIIDMGDGIYYLKGEIRDIDNVMNTLKDAKGVVIGSVSQLFYLLPHMISEPVWSVRFLVPVSIFPDREHIYWRESRHSVQPEAPFLNAKFAVLTSPSDQSSYESVLGVVDNYKLAIFVGDTTAGCNGNVNYIELMNNVSIRWTGMKVLKHDGSQHHLIGFNPDYPVTRTKEAVLRGRDEYLGKAVEILRKK